MANLQGRCVSGLATQEKAGDFSYAGHDFLDEHAQRQATEYTSLLFRCPACGTEHGVPIKPASPSGWEWDGNVEQPTLSPSIQILGHADQKDRGCRWHGFLRAGVWVDV